MGVEGARVYGPLGERVRAAVEGLPPQEQAAMSAALDMLTGSFRDASTQLAGGTSGPAGSDAAPGTDPEPDR
jgi:hypothetical protein